MNENEANLKYFEILLENSIVSKSDLYGNITFVNDNFLKVTGFSKEECMGKNHNILRHPETPDSVFKELWTTIKNGDIFRERVLSRKKDGSDFWAETIIIPLLDTNNNVIEYIAIRRDITDFLHMKRKIQQQAVDKEKQQKISKAKNDFLLLFTHELKTPLNAIINFSQYLLKNRGKVNPTKSEMLLTKIYNSSKNMLEDVTQLIELSKLKSNKLKYNLSIFSINEAIDEVLTKHISLCDELKVTLLNCLSKHNIYINSDFYRFTQILSNIISNAIKYSKGKVCLHVEEDGEYYEIIVEDNGDGVVNKEKIFEMFEQNDDDIKTRQSKGTGIGLSFVKLLCKDLNIQYKVEDSKELGGLKFSLIIKSRKV
jgi:PAS domain S-box-containing protein